jgi:hypothetical protein
MASLYDNIELRPKLGCVWWFTPITPATHEEEIGRVEVQSQPQEKFGKMPISTNKLGVVACACDSSYIRAIGRLGFKMFFCPKDWAKL